ncbi:hypothetical protein [Methylocucumis oryzae]|uniref:Aspartyl beta-hydroxylase n=1 Tax=Methylocucumis oryzae TaxID=1632867 RepID=A0A0F3ILJ6_9GAMM|nr:hypothetical protein [Methylocucumis oryzae]KJV07393.1 hypothetical protein VZ94_05045 [Methylocucumis oryzae]
MTHNDLLNGWIPLYLRDDEVHWGYMGDERFTEPFCHSSLQRLANKPFNQLFRPRTTRAALIERALSHPGLPVTGLIFHVSRCGSTLTAQALTALSNSVVLSEPPQLDQVLSDASNDHALLSALIAALGQPRRTNDERVFIKTDCWHLLHIETLLRVFPGVPWLFLYRNPIEILVSQVRMPALYLIPGFLHKHGLTPPEQLFSQPLAHAAWVLAHLFNQAVHAVQQYPNGLLVNYTELPDALTGRIAEHLQLDLTASEINAIQQLATRDAKNPHMLFTADSDNKQAQADKSLHELAEQELMQLYQALERLRLSG